MIRILFLLIIISCFSRAQTGQIQSIGTLTTYVILCPCKLFKYYENGEVFYFCKDSENQLEYLIREFKNKDKIDVIIDAFDKRIYGEDEFQLDSILDSDKKTALENYLQQNPGGEHIDLMGEKAIILSSDLENKIFFSDKEFMGSYEIIVSGKESSVINTFFDKSINSLMLKSDYLKTLF